MRRIAVAYAAVGFLSLAGAAHAQTPPETVLREYQTVKIAEGVYAFVAPESKTPFVSGNSLVVIGDDGVLVVDSTNLPSLARHMIADIKRLTDKPVRFLVNTHWHPDHLMGNEAYQQAFPDVGIIGTVAMRQAADVQVPTYFNQTVGAAGVATTDKLREVLKTGKRPNGENITPVDREFYELEMADYDVWADEVKRVHYVAPTITFDRDITVRLGARAVRIMFLGRGNTAGDAVVYVPDVKVMATGDLLVGPTPYATGSFLSEWIDVLDKLTGFGAAVIVPGHGPVEHDWQHAKRVQKLLQAVVEQVDQAVAKGLSLEDARKQVDVAAFRNEMTAGDPFRTRAFDTFFLPTAVERAYRDALYRAEK